ncbi:tyrosine-type recombinase/integrase [Rossellomorea marisflavi]|uniref:tyrosine-type recombinase/integrase n=1 Tax=Rossellomorea marisflavi TaxID=189381 RepID=UPI001318B82F|nr:tyrosine-type recombinase/integrase [Rossellomorea marisflavi]QHA36872.1 tyrosine-type recombinase/integrase [Rossellomorea marisflavi]
MNVKLAVKDFLEECELKNLSPYTRTTYRRVLRNFTHYCQAAEILEVTDIDRPAIKGFLLYCRNEFGNSPNTINLKLRIVKAFVNYLINEDLYDESKKPFRNVSYGKVDTRVEIFTEDHLRQILRYFEKESRNKPYHAYRNRTIVLMLLSTGIRRGELVNLRWRDIDLDSGMITVFGKKRRENDVPLASKMCAEMVQFRQFCEEYFDGEVGDHVFCSSKGRKLRPEAIGTIFKRLKKRFGWEDVRLSPHTLRHTFASYVVKGGMDSITVQRILRHESLQMTQRYINMWGHDLRESNEKYNPLNHLDF